MGWGETEVMVMAKVMVIFKVYLISKISNLIVGITLTSALRVLRNNW